MNDLEGEWEISWPYCFTFLRGQLTAVDDHFVIGVANSIRRKMSEKDGKISKSQDDFEVEKKSWFWISPGCV
jgi:hypothetical protein